MSTRLPTPRAMPLEPRMSIWPALKVTPWAKGSASLRLVTSRLRNSSRPMTETLTGASPGRALPRLAVTVTPGSSKSIRSRPIVGGSLAAAPASISRSTVL